MFTVFCVNQTCVGVVAFRIWNVIIAPPYGQIACNLASILQIDLLVSLTNFKVIVWSYSDLLNRPRQQEPIVTKLHIMTNTWPYSMCATFYGFLSTRFKDIYLGFFWHPLLVGFAFSDWVFDVSLTRGPSFITIGQSAMELSLHLDNHRFIGYWHLPGLVYS